MEQLIFITTAISGMMLSVLNVAAQNAKRTVNNWAREILETGRINSRETSELGTIYSNPFTNWFLEIDKDDRLLILRNSKIREKIREYRKYRKLCDVLSVIFIILIGLSFYLFIN